MIPERSRSNVDLPEPLRPTRPTALPGSTPNETSRSAQTSEPRGAAARDDQILERAVLARIDAEVARRVLDEDLALSHEGSGTTDDACERRDEGRLVIGHLDPRQLEPELLRELLRLDVDIPADLEMVGDEADRADEHLAHALRMQVA